jgi:hypothetical protein
MGKSELSRYKLREEYRVDNRNVKESSVNYVWNKPEVGPYIKLK